MTTPEPSCPQGYTRNDLQKYFGLIPGEENPLWDVVHAHEARCLCPKSDDETSNKNKHGIVHPVEHFEGVETVGKKGKTVHHQGDGPGLESW